jgi:hypothetical protein
MDWKTPAVVQIKMDAEIGSYQEDRDPVPAPIAESWWPSQARLASHCPSHQEVLRMTSF